MKTYYISLKSGSHFSAYADSFKLNFKENDVDKFQPDKIDFYNKDIRILSVPAKSVDYISEIHLFQDPKRVYSVDCIV